VTLADWFLGLMAVECAFAAFLYMYSGNLPYGLAFIGYTVANFGLLMASIK
jgi:hypothetical protein